ncbi:MAG: DUF3857 domain-containing protein [Muribaculaceae bacterium]|nr:DUF3857 domain-containing protein [Muribaculaceae bacterium]
MRKHYVFIFLASVLVVTTVKAQMIVVNDAATVVNVKDMTNATVNEKLSFTIMNERGKDMASTAIMCSPYEKLAKFEGTAVDSQGKVLHKFKKNELIKNELTENFTTDVFRMVLDYTPPCYPITITWEWQLDMSGGWITYPSFIPYPYNSHDVKVEHASYILSLPKNTDCFYKKVNFDGEIHESTAEDGGKLYAVEASDLEFKKTEDYSATLREQMPRVFFASSAFEYRGVAGKRTNWKEFGGWIYNLASKDFKFSPDFERQIHAMTDTCTSNLSKIDVLYRFLEKTTRYVSIQLGIGGLKPLPVDYTHKTGFGDCKGLSNYMRAMLDVVGIPSYFTIISTENRRLTSDFATANQCNHAILCVPQGNDTVWVECTNPSLPLGYVHEDIAGHDALLATPAGGKFVTLPQYADSLNLQRSRVAVGLAADGTASMSLEQKSFYRQYEDKIPLRYFEEKKFREKLLSMIYAPSGAFKTSSIVEEKNPLSAPCMTINAELENIHYGTVTGNRIFLLANPVHKNYRAVKKDDKRSQDVIIRYGYVDEEEIEFIIPDGYELENKPEALVVKEPFGTFTWAVVPSDKTIKVITRLDMHSGQWPASIYTKIQEFEKNVEKIYNQRLVLKKND